MRHPAFIFFFFSGAALSLAPLTRSAETAVPALVYSGPEPVTTAADGGLRPVVGVHNIQVVRANRSAPEHADKLAHTYLHAPMLAYWHGRFWLEYLSSARGESEAPCSTSLTSSRDGVAWGMPREIFPSITLPDGRQTIAHQRMGFHTARDGRLLVLAFHGFAPEPNGGTGIGRVVRELHDDSSLGPIYFIRFNRQGKWADRGATLPYPLYRKSPDAGFVSACDELLADKLVTAQWWEEDQLDDTDFYRVKGKALSYLHRPDGSVLGIWKNAQVAITRDEGQTWTEKQFAANLPVNASKYWLQATPDHRFALFFNPTNRSRHPLAVLTSADGADFSNLLSVHGERPDQRFPGAFKNLGPQYTRGIAEGDGVPPDAASAVWIAYSVNKEDIWVARVPVPITATVALPVRDTFESDAIGALPENWNCYSPRWAPIRVIETNSTAHHALELRDEDPYDYARATRVFPATHGVKISFRVFPRQANARLEIDLLEAHGARPVRLAMAEDGHVWGCHEGIWQDAGPYAVNTWQTLELDLPKNSTADRADVLFNGKPAFSRALVFSEPAATVTRISFRTGLYREAPAAGKELPGADVKSPLASFLVDDVTIEPIAP